MQSITQSVKNRYNNYSEFDWILLSNNLDEKFKIHLEMIAQIMSSSIQYEPYSESIVFQINQHLNELYQRKKVSKVEELDLHEIAWVTRQLLLREKNNNTNQY